MEKEQVARAVGELRHGERLPIKRPQTRSADEVLHRVERQRRGGSSLRFYSSQPRVEGCLRVT
jgi:hypothetical protein